MTRLYSEIRYKVVISSELLTSLFVQSLQWKIVHPILLNICVAMSSLQLPNYVLLEIVDWFEYWEVAVSHRKKIQLIENVNRSIRKINGKIFVVVGCLKIDRVHA